MAVAKAAKVSGVALPPPTPKPRGPALGSGSFESRVMDGALERGDAVGICAGDPNVPNVAFILAGNSFSRELKRN